MSSWNWRRHAERFDRRDYGCSGRGFFVPGTGCQALPLPVPGTSCGKDAGSRRPQVSGFLWSLQLAAWSLLRRIG